MSAQVKLASPVYPVYSVRRADRGPAPITRLIHLPSPALVSGRAGDRAGGGQWGHCPAVGQQLSGVVEQDDSVTQERPTLLVMR